MNLDIELTKSQEKQLSIAYKHVKNNKPCCFYGEAGIGKTTMVYIIAKRLGRKVIEFNASDERTKSDIERIMRKIRMRAMKPLLYLFDEVDYFGRYAKDKNWKALSKIVKMRAHPVIMTCNDAWKIPAWVKKNTVTNKVKITMVRVYPPRQQEVSDVLQKAGHIDGLGIVTADFRASTNAIITGGQTHRDLTIFQDAKKLLTNSTEFVPILQEKYKSDFRNFFVWVLDNATRFYTGKDLYDVIQMVASADRMNCPELLTFLPKGRGDDAKYPKFFTKKKLHGRKG